LKKTNFEESLKRLEEITEKMESNDISLDESLKLFEEGIKLSRYCEARLTEAEQKIEILKNSDMDDFSEEEPSQEKKAKKSKKKDDDMEEPETNGTEKKSFLF
jgi:exodeoxyribonuclease VII small subunit